MVRSILTALFFFLNSAGAFGRDQKAIQIEIDATDLARRIIHVREVLPAFKKGTTLNYPKWLPGTHGPSGIVYRLASLQMSLGGKSANWKRDRVEMNTFEVGADREWEQEKLSLDFDYLSPTNERAGPIEVSSEILLLQWISLVLYPSGYPLRQILIEASVLLPKDWKFATALTVKKEKQEARGLRVHFDSVNLEDFFDSPLYAGIYMNKIDLSEPGSTPVFMNIFADRPEFLEAKPEQIKPHKVLVQQALKLFESHHYDHYDFLMLLSDQVRHIGLEHHQSSEDGTEPGYFTEWEKTYGARGLLPHEFTHSWNGKYKRPADLLKPNYQLPTQNNLLWVYEGQTQYWGSVLAARSGLWSELQARESLAYDAACQEQQAGRAWRSLHDTQLAPVLWYRNDETWESWQRSRDYYHEGSFIWLEVDTLIREKSENKRSLDDFAKAFFAGTGRSPVSYEFQDVVATLNQVQPYDWGTYLKERVEGVGRPAPLEGIKRGGYRLVYTPEQNVFEKERDGLGKQKSFLFSLGIIVGEKDSKISKVLWNSPAFQANLIADMTLVAVNQKAYSSQRLSYALKEAAQSKKPMELLVRSGENFKTVSIPYFGGPRYPHLERVPGVPALLDTILKAK